MRVLGIETSCDETAAAVVEDGRRLLANGVASQAHLHGRYGGVVPEVASRQHLAAVLPVVEAALAEADRSWRDLDAIAVTSGPGLAGTLLVGVGAAKALAYAWDLPLISVNHLEAHLYANWIDEAGEGVPEPALPAVGLIVSGGHTDLVVMAGHGEIRRLGRTLDDAAGEAFDKVARLLGLGFPGGPEIERAAGDPGGLLLPRAWLGESDDFSFSGLKTAVVHLTRGERGRSAGSEGRPPPPAAAIAAAFQESVVDVLAGKTANAARREGARSVLLSGGVAANGPLRRALAERSPAPVHVASPVLCTDNGAMVAACAYYRRVIAGWDLDVRPTIPVA